MKVLNFITCADFPCSGVYRNIHIVPGVDIQPQNIKMVMVSETPPAERKDYFYASGDPFYLQTTIQAFHDAGMNVSSSEDILNRGIYLTTAIKCAKMQYAIATDTIKTCSVLLERELNLFPNANVIMLMGDVAIKAMNEIAARNNTPRIIPSGATYKIRNQKYYYEGKRIFPSYLQTGKNYQIKRSKRQMIAEDIKAAIELIS